MTLHAEDLTRTAAVATRIAIAERTGSTNADLVRDRALDPAAWPHFSVLVTDDQTDGRGRLGRVWSAPAGSAVAVSVVLDVEDLRPTDRGWIPLLAGAAMTRAVRSVVDAAAARHEGDPDEAARHEVMLKWPNDVLIDGYKVSGVLSELLPDASGLCIGTGLNLALDEHDLPTLTSTSLMLVTGSVPDPDAVLAAYLTELSSLVARFLEHGADPDASGLRAEVSELCGTLGSAVRVELPGGNDLVGTAVGLDADGRLIVEDQTNGEPQAVAAGDVTHLRY